MASPATLPLCEPITVEPPSRSQSRTSKSSEPETGRPSAVKAMLVTAAVWPSSQRGTPSSQSPTELSKLAVAIRPSGETATAMMGPP